MTFCKNKTFLAGVLAVLTSGTALAQAAAGLGILPLYFEDQASSNGGPQFLARGRSGQVLISDAGVQITRRNGGTVRLQFSGADLRAPIHGENELPGKINYLVGSDPAKWRPGLATFSKIGVDQLYPGINAVYYGNERQLEYDFDVAPGAKPEAITMRITGGGNISVNASGELVMAADGGAVLLQQPVIYQMVAGARQVIAGGYKIKDSQTVAFAIGNYDAKRALVIDPILTYSTYLGGNGVEYAQAVAVNTNDGSIFITGQTSAGNLATTNGVLQPKFQGGQFGDAFVAKFTPQGTNLNLAYLTYLGGSGDDDANAIAVNQSGNAFVAGSTDSPNFPTMGQLAGYANQIHGSINPGGTYFLDGFVTELATNGASLIYSTYIGGSAEDAIEAIAIDSSNNAYITGYTLSTNLPVKYPIAYTLGGTTNPFLNTLACPYTFFTYNAFVGKISNLGTNLDYLSYFGGNNIDLGTGIAVDTSNNVYVAGYTASTNFPNTNAFQLFLNQSNNLTYVFDAFVAKLGSSPTNPPLLYSTYLGNTNTDQANAIAVDSQGAAYVTGFTTSTNFYNTTTSTNTSGAITYPVIITRITNNVNGLILTTNVFLTKIVQTNANHHASIAYSVVFGGSIADNGYGVAVDPAGNAFVTGSTASSDFPTNHTLGYLRPYVMGGSDVFVTAFNTNCSQVLYSVYLGGSVDDYSFAIAVDSQDTAYVAGFTDSANFPVTAGSTNLEAFSTNAVIYPAHSSAVYAAYDAFLSKIIFTNFAPALYITKGKTNSVTLAWRDYTEPEIGPFTLQSEPSLLANSWTAAGTPLTLTNNGYYTNYLTVPATGTNQFFRLGQ